MKIVKIYNRKQRRKRRISSRYFGTEKKPRVAIYRSNRYIYAQVIDDEKAKTLISEMAVKKKEAAKKMGLKLAEALIKKGINQVIFDRGSYAYHGRVAAVAEGLREGELKL
jgi:large subunit ribosomal protein L18